MFDVLGGQQKCIHIQGKITMPPFKLCTTPQLYNMCYLSESSVKLETLVNMWNLESGKSSIAFLRNNDFSLISLLSTSKYQEGAPGKGPLPSAPLWGCHPLRNSSGFVCERLITQHPKLLAKVEAGCSQ